jgi:predicted phosphodiesterase
MRLAVIADIHGNIDALGAVLAHINKQNVDQIVVAGDIVIGAPHSASCWQKIQSLGCPVVRGNHERYLFGLHVPDAPASWQTERYAPIRQAYQQFSKEAVDNMRNLPTHYAVDDLLIVHAFYRNDTDAVTEKSTVDELEEMFAPSLEPVIIRAHNHVWFECTWSSHQLYSVGSVGLPLNGDSRAYAIAEKLHGRWHLEKHAVSYDLEKAIQSYDDSHYFDVAGPVGRLFRQELITARHELTPFWKKYAAVIDREELGLEQAVAQYLENSG